MLARAFTIGTFTLLVFVGLAIGFQTGAPDFMTGAPGNGDCSACHFSYPLNSGTAFADFDLTGPASILDIGTGPATLTASFPFTTRPIHGFQMTVRDGADMPFPNSFGGTFDPSSFGSNSQFAFGNQEYVTHTAAGTNQTSWSVGWTPDASPPPGPMTVYAAGNAANGNNAPIGDYIFTRQHRIYQARTSVASSTWPLGQSHVVTLEAPTVPGHGYILVASEDPTETSLGGPFVAPLNPFTATAQMTLDPNFASIFQNFQGTLDGSGNATAQVNLPPLPFLSGLSFRLAFATLDPAATTPTVTEISSAATVTLQ